MIIDYDKGRDLEDYVRGQDLEGDDELDDELLRPYAAVIILGDPDLDNDDF
jgi:hypothetical protein